MSTQTIYTRAILLSCLLLNLFSSAAKASSMCDGLADMIDASAEKSADRFILANLPQLDNQFKVTGCWDNSFYRNREACLRQDVNGNPNGRYGSCATYSAFSAATAIAKSLKIQIPPRLQYQSENLVRIYDSYGNVWDTVHPGTGSFPRVLAKIATEFSETVDLTAEQRTKLLKLVSGYQRHEIEDSDLGNRNAPSTQALLSALARHFTHQASGVLLPAEIILDGWVLDRDLDQYCAIRDANGNCNASEGEDQRSAHSALLVGRKIKDNECFVKVRNSWKACRQGYYGRSTHECDFASDTVWISEDNLIQGMSGARTFNF